MLFIFFLVSSVSAEVLQIGESQSFPLASKKVWAQKSESLDVQVISGQLLVTGKKRGVAKVKLGSQLLQIQVISEAQSQLLQKLKKLCQKTPGLTVDIENAEVTVKGQVYSWDNWKKLRAEVGKEAHFILKAKLSDDVLKTFQNEIDRELFEQGLLSMNVNTSPEVSLNLNPQQQDKEAYIHYFQKLGIRVQMTKESLTTEPTIKVKVRILEVSKSTSSSLGIIWPSEMSFKVLSDKIVNTENLQLKLSALESAGEVRTLASPILICKSGKEAEFFVGGDYPIRLKGYRAEQLQWIKYGVGMKIRPLADSSGRLNLSLETEISNLAGIVEGIPTVENSKVSSHFDLSRTQVIALSGILREQNSRGDDGLPFLRRIPILGSLFSSEKYLAKKSELVILVEPQLMGKN